MKIILFTNGIWGMPVVEKLHKEGVLGGVVLPSGVDNSALCNYLEILEVQWFELENKDQENELTPWINGKNASLALVFCFPYKIDKQVFESFSEGIYNMHFGDLPKYAGPDPLFWVLKNGESKVHIVVHRMNQYFDSGEVVYSQELQIIPGETYGLLGSRLSMFSSNLINQVIETIKKDHYENTESVPVAQLPRPTEEDLCIQWESQTADQIESLINAANPKYNGAATMFRGVKVRIIEVSPIDNNELIFMDAGSIVRADPQMGVFVVCKDKKILRINVIQMPEGVFSGLKFAALGIQAQERFTSIPVESFEEELI
ncbi:methionyl-tRNA formyltransferase [Aureibacter tunicatorum]|uniref:Methionyl-tRNA formyltransferase n=1 Tax=Aureibacter tunicatorum TaxID=866807 RepID=A0AAE4BQC3_9BACT|nr:formyltransferase family protein [Aureibacter tunicatorum]MDR6238944.1 methionyl-tRNA formyltransferase [Aureibacter tunicatorum]BDD05130.1 hypothetical protein AUTU_26130 [Aureibacter tunicatorum]